MSDRYLDPHQARRRAPTTYEDLLGDTIERAYAAGIHDLAGLVQNLNDSGLASPDGTPWTEANYRQALAVLAA